MLPLLASLSSLSSCSLLYGLFEPRLPKQEHTLHVAVSPKTAAHVIADICRREMRGADPLPMHAHAPIVSHGDREFEVRYTRHGGDAFRVFLNGRITPPANPPPRPHLCACPLEGIRFLPSDGYTGSPAGADEELRIYIRPERLANGADGCRIDIYLHGLPAQRPLVRHLTQALTAAAAIRKTARLLTTRQYELADRGAQEAIAACETDGPGAPGYLLSRLLCHRATAAAARGDLLATRLYLARALDHDDRLQAVRYWLFRTEQRLARVSDAGHGLLVFAHAARPEPLRARAGSSLLKSLRDEQRTSQPEMFERAAERSLSEWDLPAAYAWARQASRPKWRFGSAVRPTTPRSTSRAMRSSGS